MSFEAVIQAKKAADRDACSKALTDIFNAHDKDASGFLDHNEAVNLATALLKGMGEEGNIEEAESMKEGLFDKCDKNEDGKISL